MGGRPAHDELIPERDKALAIADGAAYDAPVSGGCGELISHS